MRSITCLHCFSRFSPWDVCFKCTWHRVKNPNLGPDAPLVFEPEWAPSFWRPWRSPPTHTSCPKDKRITGFRVCPYCHQDLPYYAGRADQQIIAVTGTRGSGKTVYLWSVIHQVQTILARDPNPFLVLLFEDDLSFEVFRDLNDQIFRQRKVPQFTNPVTQKEHGIRPIIARLLRKSRSRKPGVSNLVFYDPAGELIEDLDNLQYLRYLAHSSAIIYLQDPMVEGVQAGTRGTLAAAGLGHIALQLRREMNIPETKRLPQVLAVLLTKADESVFSRYPPAELIPGLENQEFWSTWTNESQAAANEANDHCKQIIEDMELHNLIAVAEQNFVTVRFFAASSLNQAPRNGVLHRKPEPVGVEAPLFWVMNMLR